MSVQSNKNYVRIKEEYLSKMLVRDCTALTTSYHKVVFFLLLSLILLVIHPGQQAISDLSSEADCQGSGP